MDQGVRVSVVAGRQVPVPLPGPLAQRLLLVDVRETDAAKSAATLEFDAGRAGPAELTESALLQHDALKTGSRVGIQLVTTGAPQLLFDGFITQVDVKPGSGPGASKMTLTCDDVSWKLEQREETRELPMGDYAQVLYILTGYMQHRIIPMALPPKVMDQPSPTERIPQQRGSDLAHLAFLANRHGYVSYAMPGPLPGTSTWYWGPPRREGLPQRAITVNQLGSTNVTGDLTFALSAHEPVAVVGHDMDPTSGQTMTVRTTPPTRMPLAAVPWAAQNTGDIRERQPQESGASAVATQAAAQAWVERAADAVTAKGTLDGARYGTALRARGLVGVRGAGWAHDGLWYVRAVEHHLMPGAWTQDFELSREGHGSTVPAVMT